MKAGCIESVSRKLWPWQDAKINARASVQVCLSLTRDRDSSTLDFGSEKEPRLPGAHASWRFGGGEQEVEDEGNGSWFFTQQWLPQEDSGAQRSLKIAHHADSR